MLRHPQSPGVILDNGAANRQSHPESFGLGGMERLKDALATFVTQPDAGVPDSCHRFPLFGALRANDEFTNTVLDRRHRVDDCLREGIFAKRFE